jgi:hypothetical protein
VLAHRNPDSKGQISDENGGVETVATLPKPLGRLAEVRVGTVGLVSVAGVRLTN